MNSISELFQRKQRNILSVYFTAGYPRLGDTAATLAALQAGGVDMAEVGIPFSDPMADGPVIQASGAAALRSGMTLAKLFEQLEAMQGAVSIPLILMGYLNPIMQHGFERFCADCRRVGVAGMIIPDLPFGEYLRDYKPVADRHGLKVIMLITPETSEERIRLIDDHTEGFIYMVSSAATTGAQERFGERTLAYFRRINGMGLRNPRLIGFGISNPETLRAAFDNASGAIVGSKFISLLTEAGSISEAVGRLPHL
ncbi:MAG: tryptophan synthase subunit alpha [Prevotellaceae bacterium]|jgi:tryptophan synthase alpha chain|nr:tryptophan synthase subunit alpha [Prevotellaceae bacterium]